jgi:hypothetical protein
MKGSVEEKLKDGFKCEGATEDASNSKEDNG